MTSTRATLFVALLTLPGCFAMRGSSGGGQGASSSREVNPADIALPAGYRIEAVATGLNFPTGVAFDEQNRPHVTESGYAYGEVFTTPRVVRINTDGTTTPIAQGAKPPMDRHHLPPRQLLRRPRRRHRR